MTHSHSERRCLRKAVCNFGPTYFKWWLNGQHFIKLWMFHNWLEKCREPEYTNIYKRKRATTKPTNSLPTSSAQSSRQRDFLCYFNCSPGLVSSLLRFIGQTHSSQKINRLSLMSDFARELQLYVFSSHLQDSMHFYSFLLVSSSFFICICNLFISILGDRGT